MLEAPVGRKKELAPQRAAVPSPKATWLVGCPNWDSHQDFVLERPGLPTRAVFAFSFHTSLESSGNRPLSWSLVIPAPETRPASEKSVRKEEQINEASMPRLIAPILLYKSENEGHPAS